MAPHIHAHTRTKMHTHVNRDQMDLMSVCFYLSCTVSEVICITVMDDNETDSMTTLDFPATSPNWPATSAAFHLNRALM